MTSFGLQDEALKKALALYCDTLLSDLPDENRLEERQFFSSGFEEKMQKLIQKAKLTPRQLHLQLMRRIAMIVLLFTLGTTALMSVEAIRIPILHFLTEVHETFTRIVFGPKVNDDASPDKIEVLYLPAFIPEGFVLDFEEIDSNFTLLAYSNHEDYFEWAQYTSDVSPHINTEGIMLEEFTLHKITYLYYSNKGMQNLIFEYQGYVFVCSGTLEKDLLIQISEGLEKKN